MNLLILRVRKCAGMKRMQLRCFSSSQMTCFFFFFLFVRESKHTGSERCCSSDWFLCQRAASRHAATLGKNSNKTGFVHLGSLGFQMQRGSQASQSILWTRIRLTMCITFCDSHTEQVRVLENGTRWQQCSEMFHLNTIQQRTLSCHYFHWTIQNSTNISVHPRA